jgi:hypothetical protein
MDYLSAMLPSPTDDDKRILERLGFKELLS